MLHTVQPTSKTAKTASADTIPTQLHDSTSTGTPPKLHLKPKAITASAAEMDAQIAEFPAKQNLPLEKPEGSTELASSEHPPPSPRALHP